MPDDRLLETLIDSKLLHRGHYLSFRVDTIADADGGRHSRDVVEHPGAVAILGLAGDDLFLVRQYRHAVRRICLEIPAGTLDRDPSGAIEDPERAAPRELAEETGHRAASWRKLGRFFTAPGFASEEMHLYLATGCEPIDGYGGPEEDERLDLVRVPWREAVRLAESGEISDAKSMAGLFWLDRLAARGQLP